MRYIIYQVLLWSELNDIPELGARFTNDILLAIQMD